jgi:hypothetical protein
MERAIGDDDKDMIFSLLLHGLYRLATGKAQ